MSLKRNKEERYNYTNNNIIQFPTKDVEKNDEIQNKFYSVDESKSKLEKSNDNENIKNFEKPNGNGKLPPKPIALTILGILLIAIAIWALVHKNAQEVYVGDKPVGIIQLKDEKIKTPEDLANAAISNLEKNTGSIVEVNEEITFKPVRASKDEIIPISVATEKVAKNFTFKVEAAIITINGQEAVIVKNKEEANKILNSIKNKYVNTKLKQVAEPTFLENVKVEDKYVAEKDILSNEVALQTLTSNKEQGKEHEIKKGDTLFELAIKNDMTLDEILKANPNLTETTPLKIGSKVNLIVPVPVISVITYDEATYNMPISKTVETIPNNKEYKTYKKVIKQGKNGTKQVTAKITRINGIEEKRDILQEKVLVEPIAEKVEVGTLNTPPKKAIGSFKYPIRGRLTSSYGKRWGTFHHGLDLAAPSGTPIKASDGGTVVFSGWNSGGYGNMVKIDHGNGYQTVYAHNSKNAVKVGQKVAQGETIAYVGNTGNSTGNHVHFEILKNGSSKNPSNFLK